MDPIIGGALIGSASSALGNLFNQGMSRRQNKRMVDFWKMQNEYNHPSAQMQRLQEAGLNPNLIYGDSVSGATGRADAIGTPDKPEFDNPISKFQDTRQQMLQWNNMKAVNDNLIKEKELKAAQILKTIAETGIKNLNKEVLGRTADSMVKKMNAEAHSSHYDSMFKAGTFYEREKAAKLAFDKAVQDLDIGKVKLSNEQKRGIMYDLENTMKRKNIEFYDSKAITAIISRLLSIIK